MRNLEVGASEQFVMGSGSDFGIKGVLFKGVGLSFLRLLKLF